MGWVLLSASETTVTFTDLVRFGSLSAARDSIIEKEIELVIRDSHAKHFDRMENRFNIRLRKGLDVWPNFIEITERRNLFVHCDGVVSSHYLKVCKEHGVDLPSDLTTGSELTVNPTYFKTAFAIIFEIGVKLGHVLWRKLQPDDLNNADHALLNAGYNLLIEERYELAKMLFSFALSMKRISSDRIRRMYLINLCIAHTFSGDQQQCNALLESEDWTACEAQFHLAVAVLKDDYAHAATIMRGIGADGEVDSRAYSAWPLFKAFRTSKEFLATYRDLFGEDFVLPEDVGI